MAKNKSSKVTKGTLVDVKYGSIRVKETIGKKTVLDSCREYALVTLDTGDTFNLSGRAGRRLEKAATGQRIVVTQDKGTITIEVP